MLTRAPRLIFSVLILIVATGAYSKSATAQHTTRRNKAAASASLAEARKARDKAKEDLTKATEEYKKSLKELMALREQAVKNKDSEFEKIKPLYAEGLMSRHELEEREITLNTAKAELADVKRQLAQADITLAQTLAEEEVSDQLSLSPNSYSGIVEHTAYFRFNGTARWGLSNAGVVESFFFTKFHKQLPISAFGQSELHNRMGFDHSNAMDVGLNPDSAEGRALIAYLESAGIPFIAFRRAVPGAASGPHIHVGRPSHKM